MSPNRVIRVIRSFGSDFAYFCRFPTILGRFWARHGPRGSIFEFFRHVERHRDIMDRRTLKRGLQTKPVRRPAFRLDSCSGSQSRPPRAVDALPLFAYPSRSRTTATDADTSIRS